jgi:hypothetical protein
MKKFFYLPGFLIIILALPMTGCSKGKNTTYYDKSSGLELSIPQNVVVTPNNDPNDFDNFISEETLKNKAKKIVSLKVKTKYCGQIGLVAYISENKILNEQCFKAYPADSDLYYQDNFYDKNRKVIPHKISINHKPFIYLSSAEGAAGNVYQASVYRGLVNNKCVLFDIYSHTPEPSLCAGEKWPSVDTSDPKFQKLVTEVSSQMNKEYNLANEIVRNAKFITPAS